MIESFYKDQKLHLLLDPSIQFTVKDVDYEQNKVTLTRWFDDYRHTYERYQNIEEAKKSFGEGWSEFYEEEYRFEGHDYLELAKAWDIKVIRTDVTTIPLENGNHLAQFYETDNKDGILEDYFKSYEINNSIVKFKLEDEEDILTEKIKEHIEENFNEKIKTDMKNFLQALLQNDASNTDPFYTFLINLEDDELFKTLFVHNLELLWE